MKLKAGNQVIIRLSTETQSAEWTHNVVTVDKKQATLDNGDKLKLNVGNNGELQPIKVWPAMAVYGQGLVKRSYTLKK